MPEGVVQQAVRPSQDHYFATTVYNTCQPPVGAEYTYETATISSFCDHQHRYVLVILQHSKSFWRLPTSHTHPARKNWGFLYPAELPSHNSRHILSNARVQKAHVAGPVRRDGHMIIIIIMDPMPAQSLADGSQVPPRLAAQAARPGASAGPPVRLSNYVLAARMVQRRGRSRCVSGSAGTVMRPCPKLRDAALPGRPHSHLAARPSRTARITVESDESWWYPFDAFVHFSSERAGRAG